MSDEEIRATDRVKPPVVVRAMNLIEQQSDAGDIETQVGFSDELRPSRRCLEHLQATKLTPLQEQPQTAMDYLELGEIWIDDIKSLEICGEAILKRYGFLIE
jgi:hypothetical protein